MINLIQFTPDSKLDLVLERVVDAPRELVWKAWTTPEQIKKWFTPAPWQTTDCMIDLRPGGRFYTMMKGPNGEEAGGDGCYLEVTENHRLVWTSALGPGYRPNPSGVQHGFVFTAVITLEDVPGGTKYTAHVIHSDEEGRNQHEQMGFHGGWGTALDQLVAMIKAEQ